MRNLSCMIIYVRVELGGTDRGRNLSIRIKINKMKKQIFLNSYTILINFNILS